MNQPAIQTPITISDKLKNKLQGALSDDELNSVLAGIKNPTGTARQSLTKAQKAKLDRYDKLDLGNSLITDTWKEDLQKLKDNQKPVNWDADWKAKFGDDTMDQVKTKLDNASGTGTLSQEDQDKLNDYNDIVNKLKGIDLLNLQSDDNLPDDWDYSLINKAELKKWSEKFPDPNDASRYLNPDEVLAIFNEPKGTGKTADEIDKLNKYDEIKTDLDNVKTTLGLSTTDPLPTNLDNEIIKKGDAKLKDVIRNLSTLVKTYASKYKQAPPA